jgi:hypothetical protein
MEDRKDLEGTSKRGRMASGNWARKQGWPRKSLEGRRTRRASWIFLRLSSRRGPLDGPELLALSFGPGSLLHDLKVDLLLLSDQDRLRQTLFVSSMTEPSKPVLHRIGGDITSSVPVSGLVPSTLWVCSSPTESGPGGNSTRSCDGVRDCRVPI